MLLPVAAVAICLGGAPNGIVETDETCDDGNGLAGDGCDGDCQLEYCGDGIVQESLGEVCDDGKPQISLLPINDFCDNDCYPAQCGNGIVSFSTHGNVLSVQVPRPEQCDDGNTVERDGCTQCEWDSTVSITSNPTGAQVWVGGLGRGLLIGETPLQTVVRQGTYRVTWFKPGYVPVTRRIYLKTPRREFHEQLMAASGLTLTRGIPIPEVNDPAIPVTLHPDRIAIDVAEITCDLGLDLLAGGEDGRIWWYQNASRRVPRYNTPGIVRYKSLNASGPVQVPDHAVPAMADVNLDRREDLVVGDGDGNLWWFGGNSFACEFAESCMLIDDVCMTPSPRTFDEGVLLETDGSPIEVGERAAPYIADLTGDGLPDLIVGNAAGELWVFPLLQPFVRPPQFGPGIRIWTSPAPYRIHPVVEDLDHDGHPELLVNGPDGTIRVALVPEGDLAQPVYVYRLLTWFGQQPIAGEFFRLDQLYFNFFLQRDLIAALPGGTLHGHPSVHAPGDANNDRVSNGLELIYANLRLGQSSTPDPGILPQMPPRFVLDIPRIDAEVAEEGQVDGMITIADRTAMERTFGRETRIEQPVCGNDIIEIGEECDFGDTAIGDGCSPECLWECGDGVRDNSLEECDDGNRISGDGCSGECRIECGNGRIDGREGCDVGGFCLDLSALCTGDLQCAPGERCMTIETNAFSGHCADPASVCLAAEDCAADLDCRPVVGPWCDAACTERPLRWRDGFADSRHCELNLLAAALHTQPGSLTIQALATQQRLLAQSVSQTTELPGDPLELVLYLDEDQDPGTGFHWALGADCGPIEMLNDIGWERMLIVSVPTTEGPTLPITARLEPGGIELHGIRHAVEDFGGIAGVVIALGTGDVLDPAFNWVMDLVEPGTCDGSSCDRFPNDGFVSSVIGERCGNQVVDPGETCDDGNGLVGDGCDPYCQTEME